MDTTATSAAAESAECLPPPSKRRKIVTSLISKSAAASCTGQEPSTDRAAPPQTTHFTNEGSSSESTAWPCSTTEYTSDTHASTADAESEDAQAPRLPDHLPKLTMDPAFTSDPTAWPWSTTEYESVESHASTADQVPGSRPQGLTTKLTTYPPVPVHDINQIDVGPLIGKGGFGNVFIARHEHQTIALKQVEVPEQPRRLNRVFREISFLNETSHPNIVGFLGVAKHPEDSQFIYLMMEILPTDLRAVLSTLAHPVDMNQSRQWMGGLLKGLNYLHDRNIIHRDLKPANLLMTTGGEVKITDFGLARGTARRENSAMTPRMGTRNYKAPEVILEAETYDQAIDMWSVGCIMGHLLAGRRIFNADSPISQLTEIFRVMGTPCGREWPQYAELTRDFTFPARCGEGLRTAVTSSPLANLFATDNAYHMLGGLLTYNPKKRITCKEAIRHPWFLEKHP